MQVPSIPPREPNSHKGTFGRALIVAGSRGMSGAASLAGYAATRSGAGLVSIAVPDSILDVVAAFDPCFMTISLPDANGSVAEGAIDRLRDTLEKATSIGIGPGLGQTMGASELVRQLYSEFPGPMVVDADAINVIAKTPGLLGSAKGPRVLTPHIGEFRRLAGEPTLTPAECRSRATAMAKDHRIVVLLKGPQTLVTDGTQTYENTTGNPGMATGGCGDVLTGVLTALCGQGQSTFDATVLGAYIHGLAGDLAVGEFGEVSLTAIDVAEFLPAAFCQHAS